MLTSIIIPSYKNEKELLPNLERLISLTKNIEVIVVGSGYEESTKEKVEKLGAKFIEEIDTGWGESCNIGAKVAKGDYLCFFEDDIQVTQNWLEPLLPPLDYDTIGATGPMLNYSIAEFSPKPSLLGRGITMTRDLIPDGRVAYWVDFLPIYCMKRSTFEQIGGFDPSFFYLCDDVDFGLRLKKAGLQCDLITVSRVYNTPPKSSGAKADYYTIRSAKRLLRKHFPFYFQALMLSSIGIAAVTHLPSFLFHHRMDLFSARVRALL